MKSKSVLFYSLVIILFGMFTGNVLADLPADWPGLEVTAYNPDAVGEGYIFIAVASVTEGVGTYLMIVDNNGDPVWYEKIDTHEIYDFKVNPNGYLSYAPFIEEHSYTGGGDVYHDIRDDNYNIVETIHGKNGYVAEGHDFQILPNGNLLQFGYYMSEVDMTLYVDGGHPAALAAGGVIQELDAQRNVVFQWRTWDYYPFDELSSQRRATGSVIASFHLNVITQDIDGNIVLGTPSNIIKINRQNGQIMWTLGGDDNDFTLIGDDADISHFGGHATYRIENGNFLMYDNGGRRGDPTSKIHEYTLDEVNMTATHVWSWIPPVDIPAWHRGNAQRLPNGNTIIGWGGASGDHIPVCTEVDPDGNIVFEMYFTDNDPQVESYRAFRFPYPPSTQAVEYMDYELAEGDDYDFPGTGVNIDIDELTGDGYNEITVTREPFSPVYPTFPTQKPPRLVPVRYTIDHYGVDGITATISIDISSFNISDPASLTVYHRSNPGQGLFLPIPNISYNPTTKQIRGTMTKFGEYALGYPDVADVPYEPIINAVESYRGIQETMPIHPPMAQADTTYKVNQELPILLSWSPKGFARYFAMQIDTDPEFGSPVVDMPYMNDGFYVFETALPATTYHYRVKTFNQGGQSQWAAGSFQTAEPVIEVTAPAKGETLVKGLDYFIKWNDNIEEDVVIELFKDDVKVLDIGTVESDRAYEWEVDFGLQRDIGYSIKISSSTDPAIFSVSDLFNINIPQGDLNVDGKVNVEDLIMLAENYLQPDMTAGDLNGDGKANLLDFVIIAENYLTEMPQ